MGKTVKAMLLFGLIWCMTIMVTFLLAAGVSHLLGSGASQCLGAEKKKAPAKKSQKLTAKKIDLTANLPDFNVDGYAFQDEVLKRIPKVIAAFTCYCGCNKTLKKCYQDHLCPPT